MKWTHHLNLVATVRFGLLACRCLVVAAGVFGPTSAARANVYATDIRLNGSATNIAVTPGTSVTISYILNEDATEGVTIFVLAGSQVVRTISLAWPDRGTMGGTNVVVWDGRDAASNNAVLGTYSVQITAATDGYADWTQITSNQVSYFYQPTGIAVNRNTSSSYYGRVFAANGGYGPGSDAGDLPGVQKFNADGSAADEGLFSSGGWSWAGDGYSPWKIRLSADDYVYATDLSSNGLMLRFDQTLATNSQALILRADNWPTNNSAVKLAGSFISGTGASAQVWMTDASVPGVGIRRWNVTGSGILATNDTGTTIVAAGPGSDLNLAAYDVALDANNQIYAIQLVTTPGDMTSDRLFKFPAYSGSGTPETSADWHVGSGDDTMLYASGVAVSADNNYVAVSFASFSSGGVRLFYATNGATATPLITPDPTHPHTDVAWDNVGNLYTLDAFDGAWRAYSPPGSNYAVTVAIPKLQVVAPPTPPVITNAPFSQIAVYGSNLVLSVAATGSGTLTYQWQLNGANILGATNSTLTVNSLQFTNAGLYTVTVVNTSGSATSAPAVVNIVPRLFAQFSANTFTLNWPGGYVLQSATNPAGPYADVQGASSPYSLVAPAGPRRFFRLRSAPFVVGTAGYSGGRFTVTSPAVPGWNFILQASTNLSSWVNLQTNTAPFSYTDANAGQFRSRFYRAVVAQ